MPKSDFAERVRGRERVTITLPSDLIDKLFKLNPEVGVRSRMIEGLLRKGLGELPVCPSCGCPIMS